MDRPAAAIPASRTRTAQRENRKPNGILTPPCFVADFERIDIPRRGIDPRRPRTMPSRIG